MEGPRAISREESPLIDAFLRELSQSTEGLPPGLSWAPAGEENLGMRAVFLDGSPVSVLLYAPVGLVLDGCTVRAADLLLLATRPDHRGQGFASLLLEDSLGAMGAEGIRVFFAPSAEGIFGRFGARRGGILWRAVLRPGDLPPGDSILLRLAHPDDAGTLWRLHQEEDPRFTRDEAIFRRLLPAGGDERALLILRGGRPVAYTFLAPRPGRPSIGVVLEYAGERRAVAFSLRSIVHRLGLEGLEIFVPSADRELLLRLRASGGDWRVGPMPGAIVILDPEALWADLGPYFARRLGEAAWRRLTASSQAGGAFGLGLGGEAVSLPDPGRLVGLFFGEGEEAWSSGFLPPGLGRSLASCLPLPLPWDRRWAGTALNHSLM